MVIATAGLGLLFLLGQWTDTDDAREAAETFLWSNAAVGEQVGGIAELRQFGRCLLERHRALLAGPGRAHGLQQLGGGRALGMLLSRLF